LEDHVEEVEIKTGAVSLLTETIETFSSGIEASVIASFDTDDHTDILVQTADGVLNFIQGLESGWNAIESFSIPEDLHLTGTEDIDLDGDNDIVLMPSGKSPKPRYIENWVTGSLTEHSNSGFPD
jgi:hypothetical protein